MTKLKLVSLGCDSDVWIFVGDSQIILKQMGPQKEEWKH